MRTRSSVYRRARDASPWRDMSPSDYAAGFDDGRATGRPAAPADDEAKAALGRAWALAEPAWVEKRQHPLVMNLTLLAQDVSGSETTSVIL